jgi:hypothetical protein
MEGWASVGALIGDAFGCTPDRSNSRIPECLFGPRRSDWSNSRGLDLNHHYSAAFAIGIISMMIVVLLLDSTSLKTISETEVKALAK